MVSGLVELTARRQILIQADVLLLEAEHQRKAANRITTIAAGEHNRITAGQPILTPALHLHGRRGKITPATRGENPTQILAEATARAEVQDMMQGAAVVVLPEEAVEAADPVQAPDLPGAVTR